MPSTGRASTYGSAVSVGVTPRRSRGEVRHCARAGVRVASSRGLSARKEPTMTMRDLIPWRERSAWPTVNRDPFLAMQRDLDSLLNDVWGNTPARNLERVFPRVNVSENPEAYRVTAELPGMEEKDVQVAFEGNLLLLSGK